jgi:hypothetical protein
MRTERTKLRDRAILLAGFAVLWAVKVFWAPGVWIRYASAVTAGVFVWWAGMEYLRYREKYRRKPDAR